MLDKDQKNIWHPYTSLQGAADNILIDSAKGIYLYTPDGRKIIDAVSSWWVNIHGHSNEYIADAIAVQAKKLEQVIFAGFTHEPAIRLSERILNIVPGNHQKIFFSDNGSTAVEVALKMAIQYWHNLNVPRKKVIALQGAYHGDTFGAMSAGERGIFTKPFYAHLFETDFIPFPVKENFQEVLKTFETLASQNNVATFIYEPLVQGAAGMRIYSPEILDKLLSIARKYDVICIADEVMTGFGRTGRIFASEYMQEKPDIICLSKGISGGVLPLGATCCNAKIVNAYESSDPGKTFFHGHSFTANPIACAAANASLDLLEKKECMARIKMISMKHEHFAVELRKQKNVKKAGSLGTILSIEIESGADTGYLNKLRNTLYNAFLENGILMRPLGNIIYLIPPYVIEENELDYIYNSILKILKNLS
ncbi:MAG: adenosylmethionine--8-amino-7-oxononanoate transaminase [Cytophagaceae bacterium]|nr:adenosylmethionine--8-amino-7-oxononanoate transaminase [Cytophagaceae bacterium]